MSTGFPANVDGNVENISIYHGKKAVANVEHMSMSMVPPNADPIWLTSVYTLIIASLCISITASSDRTVRGRLRKACEGAPYCNPFFYQKFPKKKQLIWHYKCLHWSTATMSSAVLRAAAIWCKTKRQKIPEMWRVTKVHIFKISPKKNHSFWHFTPNRSRNTLKKLLLMLGTNRSCPILMKARGFHAPLTHHPYQEAK